MSSTFSENPKLKGTFIGSGVFITVKFSNLIYFQAKRYNNIFKRLSVFTITEMGTNTYGKKEGRKLNSSCLFTSYSINRSFGSFQVIVVE